MLEPMIRRTAYLAIHCLAPLALIFCVPTQAQYPGKPIRLIVPATAGDGSDILARALGQELGARMGQSIVIENRPGAGGSIASDLVAKAPADGYALLLGNGSSHGVTPGLYPKLPYDAVRDFAPITLIATAANALVVSAALPASTPAELIALARAKPGRLNIASAGSGSLSHLSGELFKSMAGIDMVHIPYRGATPALADLAGGDIAAMVINIPTMLPLARAGKIRAIATTGARRAAALPDVPTLAESGLAGYQTLAWFGLLAPAKTPGDIITRLHAETVRALRAPAVAERIAAFGAEPQGSSPTEFGTFIVSEITKYTRVIRDANVKVD